MTAERVDRRGFLTACGKAGITSALMPGVLYTLATQAQTANASQDAGAVSGHVELKKITAEMIDRAAELAGVGPFSDEQKKMMLDGLSGQRDAYAAIRALKIANSVAPAFVFHPEPAVKQLDDPRNSHINMEGIPITSARYIPLAPPAPSSQYSVKMEDLAFESAKSLGKLLFNREITSLALTKMYLARLKRYDSKLHFVITLTEERALAQAKKADEEIAAGKYRGPLHGIPWGAKDLLAVKGYPTTWGAGGFEHQSFDEDATVVKRLDAAGAVLVAKFTLGALAMGDKWFGGRTRNPWNPEPGIERVVGRVGQRRRRWMCGVRDRLGDARLDRSPSTRCGDTGLRPTFGFVPRTGAMALSWTMDKLGPIAARVEDCALVLQAISRPRRTRHVRAHSGGRVGAF